MKILTTEILDSDTLTREVLSFIELLNNKDVNKVRIMYGFNSNTDELYEDISVSVNDLPKIFKESVRKNTINVGLSDFFIRGNDFEFHLCNDSDLHFKSSDIRFLRKVEEDWEKKGYRVYISEDSKNT